MLWKTGTSRWYAIASLPICLWLLGLTSIAEAQDCTHGDQPVFYVREKYKVREVKIESWLGFLLPLPQELSTMKVPLQPGDDFSLEKSEAGRKQIKDWMEAAEKNSDPRTRIQFIRAGITNCQENQSPPQLDVVYWIFTSNPIVYFSRPTELKQEEAERPAVTAATTASESKNFLMVRPTLNYNRTRQLFGGTQIQMHTPGGVFESLQLRAGGSSSGNEVELDLIGSRTPETTILNSLEYQLGYRYSDLPADNNRLREGKLRMQFIGVTRPLGEKGIIARFGASLEGGNQQTDLAEAADKENSLSSSGYGALKIYLGATLRTKRYSFAGSYGVQLGNQGATTEIDFVKHIGDFAFTANWLPSKTSQSGDVHKVTTLEAQLTGGIIHSSGRLPVTERFFGGNDTGNFTAGNSWRIRNGPMIRSIPQNRLNSSSAIGAVGGTSFYALNFTVARPVWGYPIIPKEIAQDPDFLPAVAAEKNTARSIFKGYYLSKLDVLSTVANHTTILDSDLAQLIALINPLPEQLPGNISDDDQEAYGEHRDLAKDRAVVLRNILADKQNLSSRLVGILKNVDGDDCNIDPGSCSFLTNVNRTVEFLKNAQMPESDSIGQVRDSLVKKYKNLSDELQAIDTSEADRLADEDMKLISPVLDTFIEELNWIAVSPVGVFDIARIWPDEAGTRFGIGGGVRVTLVNFNVTLGYAFNPNPERREGRGAFFFAMDVTNLFR